MDFNKSEEHLAIEASIEKFARNEMAPLARELDEKSEFPMELWRMDGAIGILRTVAGGKNTGEAIWGQWEAYWQCRQRDGGEQIREPVFPGHRIWSSPH
jgi:alkylation response protein AidB-like acyl-CoA dehydrogenase